MPARDRLTPETCRAFDALSAMDGLHIAEVIAGLPDPAPAPFAVPRSLSRVTCDDCGTTALALDAADAITLEHDLECYVGLLDSRQLGDDHRFLVALDDVGLPPIRVRPTLEHEAALLDSVGTDVGDALCRVDLTSAGLPRRTWPAAAEQH